MHRLCGTASVAHSENHRSTASYDVTAGIKVGERRLHGAVIDHDSAAARHLELTDGIGDKRIGLHAQTHYHKVDRNLVNRTRYGLRRTAT